MPDPFEGKRYRSRYQNYDTVAKVNMGGMRMRFSKEIKTCKRPLDRRFALNRQASKSAKLRHGRREILSVNQSSGI